MESFKKFLGKKTDKVVDRVTNVLLKEVSQQSREHNSSTPSNHTHYQQGQHFDQRPPYSFQHGAGSHHGNQQPLSYPYYEAHHGHYQMYPSQQGQSSAPSSNFIPPWHSGPQSSIPAAAKRSAEGKNQETDSIMNEVFSNTASASTSLGSTKTGNSEIGPGLAPFLANYAHDIKHATEQMVANDFIDKRDRLADALKELEQAHDRMPGPRWKLEYDVSSELVTSGDSNVMNTLRHCFSGVENGTTFAMANTSRYAELDDSALERILAGLSRPINLAHGEADLYKLADEVRRRDIAASATSIHEIRFSAAPIFTVSYNNSSRSAGSGQDAWNVDPKQMRDLYTVLYVLTAGGQARIWLVDIAKLHYSRGARWERITVVPFALFPSIFLHSETPNRLLSRNKMVQKDVLRVTHETMALNCLGKIEFCAPDEERFAESDDDDDVVSCGKHMLLRSRQDPRITKSIGPMKSVQSALDELAAAVLAAKPFNSELHSLGHTSIGADETQRLIELRKLSVQVMKGDKVSGIVLGLGNIDEVYNIHLDEQKNAIFKHVSRHAKDSTSQPVHSRSRNVASSKWNGTAEFINDPKLAQALEIHNMKRTYKCVYTQRYPLMVAFATLNGPTKLYGMVLVRKELGAIRRGRVEKFISNLSSQSCIMFNAMGFKMAGAHLPYFQCFKIDTEVQSLMSEDWRMEEVDHEYLAWS